MLSSVIGFGAFWGPSTNVPAFAARRREPAARARWACSTAWGGRVRSRSARRLHRPARAALPAARQNGSPPAATSGRFPYFSAELFGAQIGDIGRRRVTGHRLADRSARAQCRILGAQQASRPAPQPEQFARSVRLPAAHPVRVRGRFSPDLAPSPRVPAVVAAHRARRRSSGVCGRAGRRSPEPARSATRRGAE